MAIRLNESDTTTLDLLLEKVYRHSGYDFREYKRGTVTRRLQRRLRVVGMKTYRDYLWFLDTHPEEYQRLTEDFTIKTSSFFRNPYAFQQVTRIVLPELIANKRKQGEHRLRLWSAACAHGEEPYSIAIMLNEYLGHSLPDFDILIHATDISRQALEEAQAGIYSSKDVKGLNTAILESCFTHRGESYVLRADIKQMVSFSYFDLTSTVEQPFVNQDCIFCCNVLIYLRDKLQERVLGMLYNSLATPGYLILGEVETPPSNLREKLECLDIKARIYRKNERE